MRLFTLALLSLVSFAQCGTVVVDKVATFEVAGVVRDEAGAPMKGVEVYFVDTGLDSHQRSTKLLGSTRDDGAFEQRFRHGWGQVERGLSGRDVPSRGQFTLRFVSSGKVREVNYDVQSLPRVEKAYRVTFNVTL
jgi:hypothetical protein